MADGDMDNIQYQQNLEESYRDFEATCRHCGACCGAYDGDACLRLLKTENGGYYCTVYDNRFGPQETVSGKIFTCVSIGNIRKYGYLCPECGYNRAENRWAMQD